MLRAASDLLSLVIASHGPINWITYSLESGECAELVSLLCYLSILRVSLVVCWLVSIVCSEVRVEGGDRAGQVRSNPTGGPTFDPALERDLGLSSNTILRAYSPSVAACCSPQWSASPGSPVAERPPGALTAIRRSFTAFSPLYLRPSPRKRGKTQ